MGSQHSADTVDLPLDLSLVELGISKQDPNVIAIGHSKARGRGTHPPPEYIDLNHPDNAELKKAHDEM